MTTLKIIYLITTLTQGGGERNMVQYCLSMDRQKYEIEVWCLYQVESSFAQQLKKAGVTVRYLATPGMGRAKLLYKVGRQLSKVDADLVHVFLPTVAYYAVFAKAFFRMKTPFVFSSGGVAMTLPAQRSVCRFGIGRYAYPIICNSPAVKSWWTNLGVNPERTRVIPNGHDLQRYRKPVDRSQIRKELCVGDKELLILTVGRLIDSKRVCDLLHAFSDLTVRFPNRLRLVVVGDGPTMDALVELSKSLGLQDRVSFLGLRSDVIALLKSSDIFAFPSESEGLPNAVIEAALAGVPIAGSNIQPVMAVVENRKTALLVDTRSPEQLADAIAELIENNALAQSLANSAKQVARSAFRLESTLEMLEKAYHDAIKFQKA